ncbi:MAG TPA: carboxypeptidase-like regulatory domain-containing protein, partial [Bryobacteraceae bacterium]|nr:carboxypeptidase-like regulatory domain-containing protein [Bryobacteraceae bacterium]
MSFLPKVTRVIAGVCLAIVPAFLPVRAQTGAGTIRGTVQDASQAVVPGAKIRLTNQDTNVTQESTSSAAGIYYFGGLQPGRYQVSVEASGFKRWSGTLLLAVGQTAAVDVNLEVGSLANTVEVSGASPLINTETMGVADVKDSLRIHQLPLNGRDVTNLFNLTPGVEGGGPSPRVNGGKVGSTEILQDGISQVDRFGGGMTRVRPGLDTVQEFRIETSGSSAKYAHPATVLLVTKSGTNSLHGSVFETFRDNAGGLRARQRQDGNTPAKYIRNEFGASAGGPVFIPKLYNGKDKSFWFFSYEGMRLRQSYFDQDYVPTAQMWNGDFSQVVDNSGNRTHIYDPTTTNAQGLRMPFPGDIIPQSRISPFFGVMKSVTNTPTTATNPFQDYNLFTFYPLQQNNDTFTVKGDQKISDKDSLSGRFTRSRLHVAQSGGRYGS